MPRVSVIMSVYNSELYLREAVESVLNQTFVDFEFLISDDKSTDGSLEILKSYSDSRIQIFENQENIGLTRSLNKLLSITKGEFIARMDADDINMPLRFEKQVYFLENNPEVILCGTQVFYFRGDEDVLEISKFPIIDKNIKLELTVRNPIAHPTVMWRKDFLNGNSLRYDPNLKYSQDYALWCSMASVGEFANLELPLLKYRLHGNNIGSIHRNEQRKLFYIIREKYIDSYFADVGLNKYYFLYIFDCDVYDNTQNLRKSLACHLALLNIEKNDLLLRIFYEQVFILGVKKNRLVHFFIIVRFFISTKSRMDVYLILKYFLKSLLAL